jgi:hypothetical protein
MRQNTISSYNFDMASLRYLVSLALLDGHIQTAKPKIYDDIKPIKPSPPLQAPQRACHESRWSDLPRLSLSRIGEWLIPNGKPRKINGWLFFGALVRYFR